MIKADIINQKEIGKRLNKISANIAKNVGRELARGALLIEGEMVLLISKGERTGKIYQRGDKFHQASAPNEPPKTDTGFLVRSINHNRVKQLEYNVVVLASYARDLEYGTVGVKPRPFVKPTVDEISPKIRKRILQVIN